MDAFAITGIAAGPQDNGPEWFRVQGAVGGNDEPPKLFPRIQVVKRDTIADLIAGGRIVYVMRPDSEDVPDRVRVRVDADGTPRLESVSVGGPTEALDDLPRFPFAAQATDADIEHLRAIARGDPAAGDEFVERYLSYGWVREGADGALEMTDIGRDLVRSRFM
jgi:hypothetical protein